MPKFEKDEIPTSPKAKTASGIINVVSKKSIRNRNKNAKKKEYSDIEYSSNSEEDEEVSESEEETEEDSEEHYEDSDEETEESEEESEHNEKKKKNKKKFNKHMSTVIKEFNKDEKKRKLGRKTHDKKEFNKILQKMFPSKYIKKKAQEFKNK